MVEAHYFFQKLLFKADSTASTPPLVEFGRIVIEEPGSGVARPNETACGGIEYFMCERSLLDHFTEGDSSKFGFFRPGDAKELWVKLVDIH